MRSVSAVLKGNPAGWWLDIVLHGVHASGINVYSGPLDDARSKTDAKERADALISEAKKEYRVPRNAPVTRVFVFNRVREEW